MGDDPAEMLDRDQGPPPPEGFWTGTMRGQVLLVVLELAAIGGLVAYIVARI